MQPKDIIQHAPIGLALVHLDGGTYTLYNDVYERIIGYSIDEAQKKSYWDITPQKYCDQEDDLLDTLRRENGAEFGPYYKQYFNRTIGLVPVVLNCIRIDRDSNERYIWSAVEVFGEVPDPPHGPDDPITCGVCTEPLLGNDILQTLCDKAPIGLAVTDLDGCFQYANDYFCELLCREREAILRMKDREIIPRKYARLLRDVAATLRATGSAGPFVTQYVAPRPMGLVPVNVRAHLVNVPESYIVYAVDDLARLRALPLDVLDGDAPFPHDHPRR
jgi:PAS domain S-box-containing protein